MKWGIYLKKIVGKLIGNKKGFGFVEPEGDAENDIFVAEGDLHGAMHGDIVRIELKKKNSGKRPEGKVIEILERGVQTVTGTFEDHESHGFVIVDDKKINQDIYISKKNKNGAVDGHKVVVEITKYPEDKKNPEGIVSEILGHKNDPGVDILSILYMHGIQPEFPERVMEEVLDVENEVDVEKFKSRRDLRNERIITIDGADSKDLDDAVAVTKQQNGNYKLGVHIADVSHYVRSGSYIDEEAQKRGTSVYVVDRVVPMLPHLLSNGICSLNPKVERLTLSCEMEINEYGQVVKEEVFESIIKTTERMTYGDVNEILNNHEPKLMEKYKHITPMLEEMKELARILRKKRESRGSIDFDLNEAKIKVDEFGKPTDIILRERSVGEKLIEEFMLVANETIAKKLSELKIPAMFRIHENPNPQKLTKFFSLVASLGYHPKADAYNLKPVELQNILNESIGTDEEKVISSVMLRTMQQAKYVEDNLGHFGLAADYYTHFTSPIRRYPDLIVHRLIKHFLLKIEDKNVSLWHEKIKEIAEHSSRMERVAIEAERDTEALKKAEFMLDKIGEEFDAVISGVTKFGMFVELENTIEGLVPLKKIKDDKYHYQEDLFCLVGEHSKKVYRLGDKVKVKLDSVNTDEKEIEFQLILSSNKGKKNEKEKNGKKEGSRKDRFNRKYQ
jgi:ribonuclease R